MYIKCGSFALVSTTIESRKFRIPSDLRRHPGCCPVSSKVGDHLQILLGVVVHSFWVFRAGDVGAVVGAVVNNTDLLLCLVFVS
jgi:hypothetical protein